MALVSMVFFLSMFHISTGSLEYIFEKKKKKNKYCRKYKEKFI